MGSGKRHRNLLTLLCPMLFPYVRKILMPNSDYPNDVSEVLDATMTFRPAALRAVRAYAKSKPWRGTLEERRQKIRVLYASLAAAYGVPEPTLVFGDDGEGDSGRSGAIPAMGVVILRGRISAVTALHEFAHLLRKDERGACRWSLNLFRRCFPKSWGRLRFDGHMARRAS
jgi:hypothetical protein